MSRITIRDRNNRMPEVISKMNKLNGAKIRVGVLQEGKTKMIASVQEFGCNIPVTPKMRRYLASQGLYLKKETQYIRIPERSFIRAGWDENEENVIRRIEDFLDQALHSGVSAAAVLDGMGMEAQSLLRDFARDLRNPENHPFTIEQKGSNNPLVDTGNLILSIDYEIL